MIIGIGVDSVELARMTPRLAEKILTPAEQALYAQKTPHHQREFLAGRFAAKEAYAKACGTGIGDLSFQAMSILTNAHGAPYFVTSEPDSTRVHVSITHDTVHATAFVVIERCDQGSQSEEGTQ